MTRGKRLVIGMGVLAAALAFSGCSGVAGEDTGGDMDPTGTWGDSSTQGEPFLTLEDGGDFTGSDGCNTLNGTWSVNEADQVEFENVASTRMACEDVDDWLAGMSAADVADDSMTVLGQDGSPIGTLERSG
ncbi:META domain-containing protein [Agromyces sp. GXS1127]|uniref:META domain-containing protein n=1 Tax=Agromyces sp. GXS1127 TaxID=3424181 RepID=UPI003D3221F0